jgi:hypothetical protein
MKPFLTKRFACFFVIMIALSLTLNVGCLTHHYHYPFVVQSEPPPSEAPWPELTIQATDPKRAALIRNEFVCLGWDARRVKIEFIEEAQLKPGEDPRLVKVVVNEGDMDFPVTEIGVDSISKGAIRGIVASYYPVSSNQDCRLEVPANHWKPPTPDGPMILEVKKPDRWEYKYGRKGGENLVFENCVQSSIRLELSRLPWRGDWKVVSDRPLVRGVPQAKEILRAWFEKRPFSISIAPIKVIRVQ